MSVGCHFCTCLKLNKRFVSGWAVWLMMLNGVRCPWPSTHFIRAITVLSTELSPVPIPLTGGVCSLWVRQGAALLSGGENAGGMTPCNCPVKAPLNKPVKWVSVSWYPEMSSEKLPGSRWGVFLILPHPLK